MVKRRTMESIKGILLAASALTLLANSAFAQEEEVVPDAHEMVSKVFLCMPGNGGIPGTSTVAGFEGCHEAKTVTYGIQNPATPPANGGASTVKPVLSSVEVVRDIDESSPVFFQKATEQLYYPTATIIQATVDTVDGVVMDTAFSLKLGTVQIQKVETVLGETPSEKITFGSNTIKVTVGAASACWNKQTSKATCPAN